MDPKLYKTLKQLVKLGIINNNTRIRQVRRKRRKRKATSSSSVLGGYAQPSDYLRSNVVYSSPSATIQSEQALVNLKASEAQLEKALNNKSLPYEYKDDVLLALRGIQKQIETNNKDIDKKLKLNYVDNNKLNLNFADAYSQLPGIIDTRVNNIIKAVDYVDESPDIKAYNDMVPQTKLNTNMNSYQGINREAPNINIINTPDDKIENIKSQYTEDTTNIPDKVSSKPIRIKNKVDRYTPEHLIRINLVSEYANKNNISVSEAKSKLHGKHLKTIQKMLNQMPFKHVDSVDELEKEFNKIINK